jgi:hypothetical protein
LPSARRCCTLSACATTSDIEATRYQIDQVNRQANARLTEVESKLSNEKLLEMVNQVESLKAEVAKLRGEVEVATTICKPRKSARTICITIWMAD